MGRLRICSRAGTPFEDRLEAGRLLGEELAGLRDRKPVVLGIPRGGLVVAHEVAAFLDAEMDAFFALKLRFPGRPELAVGAVAEGGKVILDRQFVLKMGLEDLIDVEKKDRLAELSRRARLIRAIRPRVPLAGRTVIITDDGVATGSTLRAAFRAARQDHPGELIGAVPVGIDGAIEKLAAETDAMVCLRCPPSFLAVSQFYRRFPQVSEEEAVRLFRR